MRLLHRVSAKIKFSQQATVGSLKDHRSQFPSLTVSNQKVVNTHTKEQAEKLQTEQDAAKTGRVCLETGQVSAVT